MRLFNNALSVFNKIFAGEGRLVNDIATIPDTGPQVEGPKPYEETEKLDKIETGDLKQMIDKRDELKEESDNARRSAMEKVKDLPRELRSEALTELNGYLAQVDGDINRLQTEYNQARATVASSLSADCANYSRILAESVGNVHAEGGGEVVRPPRTDYPSLKEIDEVVAMVDRNSDFWKGYEKHKNNAEAVGREAEALHIRYDRLNFEMGPFVSVGQSDLTEMNTLLEGNKFDTTSLREGDISLNNLQDFARALREMRQDGEQRMVLDQKNGILLFRMPGSDGEIKAIPLYHQARAVLHGPRLEISEKAGGAENRVLEIKDGSLTMEVQLDAQGAIESASVVSGGNVTRNSIFWNVNARSGAQLTTLINTLRENKSRQRLRDLDLQEFNLTGVNTATMENYGLVLRDRRLGLFDVNPPAPGIAQLILNNKGTLARLTAHEFTDTNGNKYLKIIGYNAEKGADGKLTSTIKSIDIVTFKQTAVGHGQLVSIHQDLLPPSQNMEAIEAAVTSALLTEAENVREQAVARPAGTPAPQRTYTPGLPRNEQGQTVALTGEDNGEFARLGNLAAALSGERAGRGFDVTAGEYQAVGENKPSFARFIEESESKPLSEFYNALKALKDNQNRPLIPALQATPAEFVRTYVIIDDNNHVTGIDLSFIPQALQNDVRITPRLSALQSALPYLGATTGGGEESLQGRLNSVTVPTQKTMVMEFIRSNENIGIQNLKKVDVTNGRITGIKLDGGTISDLSRLIAIPGANIVIESKNMLGPNLLTKTYKDFPESRARISVTDVRNLTWDTADGWENRATLVDKNRGNLDKVQVSGNTVTILPGPANIVDLRGSTFDNIRIAESYPHGVFHLPEGRIEEIYLRNPTNNALASVVGQIAGGRSVNHLSIASQFVPNRFFTSLTGKNISILTVNLSDPVNQPQEFAELKNSKINEIRIYVRNPDDVKTYFRDNEYTNKKQLISIGTGAEDAEILNGTDFVAISEAPTMTAKFITEAAKGDAFKNIFTLPNAIAPMPFRKTVNGVETVVSVDGLRITTKEEVPTNYGIRVDGANAHLYDLENERQLGPNRRIPVDLNALLTDAKELVIEVTRNAIIDQARPGTEQARLDIRNSLAMGALNEVRNAMRDAAGVRIHDKFEMNVDATNNAITLKPINPSEITNDMLSAALSVISRHAGRATVNLENLSECTGLTTLDISSLNLTPQLTTQILSSLPNTIDTLKAGALDLTNNDLWTALQGTAGNIITIEGITSLPTSERPFSTFTKLETLKIIGTGEININAINSAPGTALNLTVEGRIITSNLHDLTNVTRLTLSGTQTQQAILNAEQIPPNLTHLTITGRTNINSVTVTQKITQLNTSGAASIKTLNLNGNGTILDQIFLNPNLENINFNGVAPTSFDFMTQANLPKLKTVNFENVQNLPDNKLSIPTDALKLESITSLPASVTALEITNFTGTADQLKKILDGIEPKTGIKKIDISGSKVDASMFGTANTESVFKNFTALEEINLTNAQGSPEDFNVPSSIKKIEGLGTTNVTHLYIRRNDSIDSVLRSLRGNEKISYLDISGCQAITERTFNIEERINSTNFPALENGHLIIDGVNVSGIYLGAPEANTVAANAVRERGEVVRLKDDIREVNFNVFVGGYRTKITEYVGLSRTDLGAINNHADADTPIADIRNALTYINGADGIIKIQATKQLYENYKNALIAYYGRENITSGKAEPEIVRDTLTTLTTSINTLGSLLENTEAGKEEEDFDSLKTSLGNKLNELVAHQHLLTITEQIHGITEVDTLMANVESLNQFITESQLDTPFDIRANLNENAISERIQNINRLHSSVRDREAEIRTLQTGNKLTNLKKALEDAKTEFTNQDIPDDDPRLKRLGELETTITGLEDDLTRATDRVAQITDTILTPRAEERDLLQALNQFKPWAPMTVENLINFTNNDNLEDIIPILQDNPITLESASIENVLNLANSAQFEALLTNEIIREGTLNINPSQIDQVEGLIKHNAYEARIKNLIANKIQIAPPPTLASISRLDLTEAQLTNFKDLVGDLPNIQASFADLRPLVNLPDEKFDALMSTLLQDKITVPDGDLSVDDVQTVTNGLNADQIKNLVKVTGARAVGPDTIDNLNKLKDIPNLSELVNEVKIQGVVQTNHVGELDGNLCPHVKEITVNPLGIAINQAERTHLLNLEAYENLTTVTYDANRHPQGPTPARPNVNGKGLVLQVGSRVSNVSVINGGGKFHYLKIKGGAESLTIHGIENNNQGDTQIDFAEMRSSTVNLMVNTGRDSGYSLSNHTIKNLESGPDNINITITSSLLVPSNLIDEGATLEEIQTALGNNAAAAAKINSLKWTKVNADGSRDPERTLYSK